jgi:predicted ATPase
MKIESLRLRNFKVFQDVKLEDIPGLCVVVGANGSTLLSEKLAQHIVCNA